MEAVEAKLDLSQQKVLKIRMSELEEALLSAFGSRIGRQRERVSSLDIQIVTCDTKAAAEAWASLLPCSLESSGFH